MTNETFNDAAAPKTWQMLALDAHLVLEDFLRDASQPDMKKIEEARNILVQAEKKIEGIFQAQNTTLPEEMHSLIKKIEEFSTPEALKEQVSQQDWHGWETHLVLTSRSLKTTSEFTSNNWLEMNLQTLKLCIHSLDLVKTGIETKSHRHWQPRSEKPPAP